MLRKNSKNTDSRKKPDNKTIIGRKVDGLVNLKKQKLISANHGWFRREVSGLHRDDNNEEKL